MEAASLIERHFVRLLFIHLEQSRLLGGEVAIQDVEVGFVVQLRIRLRSPMIAECVNRNGRTDSG